MYLLFYKTHSSYMLRSPIAAIFREVFLKEYYRERQSSLQIWNVKLQAISLKSALEK